MGPQGRQKACLGPCMEHTFVQGIGPGRLLAIPEAQIQAWVRQAMLKEVYASYEVHGE